LYLDFRQAQENSGSGSIRINSLRNSLEVTGVLKHHWDMAKRVERGDFAQNALRVVEISTGGPLKPKEKNPAAVALGKLGGIKGGKGRAESMTAERRREIAQKAGKARWAKEKGALRGNHG
jgi:hypothetical protein